MTPMNTDEGREENKTEGASALDSSLLTISPSYPCPSVSSVANLLPLPLLPINVRVGTRADIPFIDALQKLHSKALGFFPRAQLEGYIDHQWVLVAESVESGERGVESKKESSSLSTPHSRLPTPLGYLASRDRYLKRDELVVIYQLCVSPSVQRGLIGATLLKAAFERSAYGCRLYCCWCAQDLAANKFWEAMGFQAIAFRSGSEKRGKNGSARTHIFWQKRIREGDTGDVSRGGTPWWFPAKTEGGAMREDRLVLPIPPGLRWDDAMPILMSRETKAMSHETKAIEGPAVKRAAERPTARAKQPTAPSMQRVASQFGPPGARAMPAVEPSKPPEAKPRERQPKRKATACDAKLVAAARELRDRWLEEVNASAQEAIVGKYDVCRAGQAQVGAAPVGRIFVEQRPVAPPLALPLPVAA